MKDKKILKISSLKLQVLTYAQQSKEQAKIEQDKLEKRIQEFRTQSELSQSQASDKLPPPSSAVGMNGFGMSAYKNMETITLATSKGEVSYYFCSLLLDVECFS